MRGRWAVLAGLLAALLLGAAPAVAGPPAQTAGPGLPQTAPVALDPATTAVLVLDMSTRCNDPQQVCREIAPGISRLLDTARQHGVFIAYTVSAAARGTDLGDVWQGFNRRPDEPVLYPDGFDKFVGGDLQALLAPRGIRTLVLTGSSTNVAILYTATAAARLYGYDVVIPVDGVNADTPYQQEYALYQLTVLPGMGPHFRFSTLDSTSFTGT
ncbi:MAG TPA: isochorismatase family protein [Chloroflexota bacterium]|nr:isochorismatase family protein [Chloroflexota bacterium]